MELKTLIYTTSKTAWWEDEYPFIRATIEQAKGVTVSDIDVERITIPQSVPTRLDADKDVKPTWAWFKRTYTDEARARGYNAVGWHLTDSEFRKLGFKGYSGTYNNDTDDMLEFIIRCNKGERARHYDMLEFTRLLLHELGGHGFERWIEIKAADILPHDLLIRYYEWSLRADDTRLTHFFDYELRALPDFFKYVDARPWTINKLKVTAYTLMRKLLWRQTIQYPIDQHLFINRVSQRFGLPSSAYRSGMHNGTDFAVVTGTPVYAPFDGEVTHVFNNNKTMGNACYFSGIHKDTRYYMRFLHLRDVPTRGTFKKGQIIGFTGNTGQSTAPHLHLELWRNPIDTKVLYSKEQTLSNLIDPYKFFRYEVDGIIV